MKFSFLKKFFSLRAQTVIELAIFGAILTFILGIMIRQSLTFNYAQSQNFKAMRMAMAESFKTAESGHTSRNSASLIFIEDRISAEIGKYGALTRTPAFASGSATFSKNLSMPIDYPSIATDGNPNICNSKYPACFSHDCSGALFYDGGEDGGSEGFLDPLKKKGIDFAWNPFICPSAYAQTPPPDPMSDPCCSPCNHVDCQITPDHPSGCCTKSGCEAVNCQSNPGHPCCPPQGCPAVLDCANNPQAPCCFPNGCPFVNCAVTPQSECCFNPGCKIVDCASNPDSDCCKTDVLPPGCESVKDLPIMDMFINGKHFTFTMAGFREYPLTQGSESPHPKIYSQAQWDADWNQPFVGCANMRVLYTVVPNFSGEGIENTWNPNCGECFDLDRDGTIDVPTLEEQAEFDWQWQKVCAMATEKEKGGINLAKNQHARLDVDGDLKEETILQMVDEDGVQYTPFEEGRKGNHRVIKVRVLDDQAGDIDNTWSKNPATNAGKLRPGLRDELQIYTFTREGTYLLLEEGKDVNPEPSGNQTVVSTQKRNNADIIQRMIQLSNNTSRFCQGGLPNTMENPGMEGGVCAANEECFNQQNIYKTCFATDTLMLYVRSRIGDLRGRKWITDLGPRGY